MTWSSSNFHFQPQTRKLTGPDFYQGRNFGKFSHIFDSQIIALVGSKQKKIFQKNCFQDGHPSTMRSHGTRSKRQKTTSGDTSSATTSPQQSASSTPSPVSVATLPATETTSTVPASTASPKQRKSTSTLSLSTSKSKVGNPFGTAAATLKTKRKRSNPVPSLIDDYKRYVHTSA